MPCFKKKGVVLSKLNSNSLDSNLFRGQIWDKIPHKPCLGGEFCILTKMFLGVYFKTFVHACVHLHIWVAPLGSLCSWCSIATHTCQLFFFWRNSSSFRSKKENDFIMCSCFCSNLCIVMYRKFRNVPLFKFFSLICSSFWNLKVGKYGNPRRC